MAKHRKPGELNDAERVFALEYLANGLNATRAYQKVHPRASRGTAAVEGYRHLRKPHIADFITNRSERLWKALQMSGEEAMSRIADLGRFDLSVVLDDTGKLLTPDKWPAGAGAVLESVDFTAGKAKVGSRLPALRLVAEQTGKIGSLAASVDDLAAAIRGDVEKHGAEK